MQPVLFWQVLLSKETCSFNLNRVNQQPCMRRGVTVIISVVILEGESMLWGGVIYIYMNMSRDFEKTITGEKFFFIGSPRAASVCMYVCTVEVL